jgi:DNA ligase (NAD+)
VLTYDDIPFSESLGATAKFPRDAIAFKWADELRETTLLHIEWNTSRTGLINPVAVFEPVELEGTTVTRASVHNVSILRELALSPGDRIAVYKANMIIPQVAENLTRSGSAPAPHNCPECAAPTEIVPGASGEALYCTSTQCPAQRLQSLSHFVSRNAMNISGLSEQTLEKLIAINIIKTYADIFNLHEHEAQIISLEGFGRKSFDGLIAAVEQARQVNLPNFLTALGIRHLGLANAKLLARHYNYDAKRIIQACAGEDFADELSEIKGFGEALASSLHRFFSDESNITLLERVLPLLHFQDVPTPMGALPLDGLNFVLTGDVTIFANRKALQNHIEQHGGKVTGSVTSKTNYLINNDTSSTSGKNKKAALLGVPVLNESELMKLTQG